MRPDVIDLREFYAGRLGQVARHLVRRHIRLLWPDVTGQCVVGLGYATPYLRQFHDEAARVLGFMPAAQGVTRWPAEEPGLVALVDDYELPLPDASVDRLLLVHALENTEQARPFLREIWRVLSSSGRLLVVVPNRRGIWSRFERTPFGHGQPFSPGQLSRLLRDNMFQPTQRATALYVPPINSNMLLRAAPAWERLGGRTGPAFAGVLLAEADKQIYAMTTAQPRLRRRPVLISPARVAREAEAPGLRRDCG